MTLLFAALMAVAIGVAPNAATASSVGFPMYTWGINNNGQLGQGDFGSGTQRLVPTRAGEAENWIQASTAGAGSMALNAEGHIYAWGAFWTAPQMGQGGNPGSGLITAPTRIGDRDDWVYISSAGSFAAAINNQGHLYTWGSNVNGQLGHNDTVDRNVPDRVGSQSNWVSVCIETNFGVAINDQGHLYTWGRSQHGQLGQGTFDSSISLGPQRVGTANNWIAITSGSNGVAAINDQGHLYTWGRNHHGQLGHGDFANRNIPIRVGTASNWVVGLFSSATFVAINSNGEIYSWGDNATGRLGRIANVSNPANLPGRVGTSDNWTTIGGSSSHILAMTEDMRLYAWGANNQGQLGIGTIGGYADEPTFVLQAFSLAGFSQAGAGSHSIALMRTESIGAIESYLTKHLQRPEGINLLDDINFIFAFERHSFNGNTAHANQVPNIPNRTMTFNNLSPSFTVVGITTVIDSINVLEGIEFTRPGIYSWIVTELPTAGITPPSNIVDSQAVYELRVYVSQDGSGGPLYIYTITLYRLYCDDGEELDPPKKTDDFSFTNIYTRTTTGTDDCYGALVISKNVTGPFADLSTVFDFEVVLTRTALCPENTTFTGQVYNADGTTSGASITFASGASTAVQLTHGQRLVIDELLVGTRFAATELAAPMFTASVIVRANGVGSGAANGQPNESISTGTHFAGDYENSAAFTNVHFYTPPTGLNIVSASYILPIAAGIMILAIFATKKRKKIEQLPLIGH